MARRLLVGFLLGVLIGAVLCAGLFGVRALLDGTRPAEALGFSLVVAVVGGFLGGIVGAAVGLGKLGSFGGALAGLLVSLVVAGLYVIGFSRAGQYGHFLSESRIIIVGLTTPLILTGVSVAALRRFLAARL
ncbi:MAG: hypothetical protein KIS95_07830 [Anaerolineae bacterium]|uniref:hypothetical protein n=1 Tax=Promineifilum sp. TaxID=2664178 RepID=UPI001D336DE1|nr:hypothetical protein [Anaerolineales bacterium]MCB8934470.1 hypothetical protein [Promineifilum sp.]MCO5179960.1 hypothetical protein [Promineifilum sp.]MCW5847120.1 hypothetical protein [Anaerolineae bacterium]